MSYQNDTDTCTSVLTFGLDNSFVSVVDIKDIHTSNAFTTKRFADANESQRFALNVMRATGFDDVDDIFLSGDDPYIFSHSKLLMESDTQIIEPTKDLNDIYAFVKDDNGQLWVQNDNKICVIFEDASIPCPCFPVASYNKTIVPIYSDGAYLCCLNSINNSTLSVIKAEYDTDNNNWKLASCFSIDNVLSDANYI